MKTTIYIIGLFLYLFSYTGIAINIHHCGGEISEINFLDKEASCGCGDKKMPMGCCEDQVHFFKVEDSHQNTSKSEIPSSKSINIYAISKILQQDVCNVTNSYFCNYYIITHPQFFKCPSFIRNRVLLI